MSEYLSKLLTESILAPSDEIIEKRNQAILKYSQIEDGLVDKSLELVKFIFQLENKSGIIDEFRQYFIESDSEFPVTGRMHELRILADATLAHLIENNPLPSLGITLSLAVIDCYGYGLRDKPKGSSIIKFSDNYLKNKTIDSRRITEINSMDIRLALISDESLIELETAFQDDNYDVQGESLKNLFGEITANAEEYSKNVNRVFDDINRNNKILREESEILWWMFSNRSYELNKLWCDIDPLEGCLVIGKELSNLIRVIPGPLSSEQLVKKIFMACQEKIPLTTTIGSILPKVSRTWKEALINKSNQYVNDLTPIHLALKKSLEIDAHDELIESFKANKIDVSKRIDSHLLGLQIYRECLYIKNIQSGGE